MIRIIDWLEQEKFSWKFLYLIEFKNKWKKKEVKLRCFKEYSKSVNPI